MMFNFSIKTFDPVQINVAIFSEQIGVVLNALTNQDISKITDIQFAEVKTSSSLPLTVLESGKSLFSYQYYDSLTMQKDGGYVLYSFNEHWKYHGDSPFHEFSVIELHRSSETMQIAIALAISVAAAKYLKTDSVQDTSGVLPVGDDDHIQVSKIISFAVLNDLPLKSSIAKLYENLRL